ncbi:MAG TPA: hypothetical protein VF240_02135 [Pyrinomonadaceae bacterium]
MAEKVIATLSAQSGLELGYDEPSVEWVDGFIERQRLRFSGEEAGGLVNVIGAFVGECVIANHGGRWREDEHGWGVCFDDGNAAYPFAKVRKQFDNGREGGDSVHSFYETIGVLFKRSDDV